MSSKNPMHKADGNEPSAGERKISLLVIEDDENISTAIKEYFARAGYVVSAAGDAAHRWERSCRVLRLTPTGELSEGSR